MTLKFAKYVSLAVIVAAIAFSLWARVQLPDAPIATHYDFQGQVNGYMPRDVALAFGPGLAMVLYVLLLWVLPPIMPKSASILRSEVAYGVVAVVTIVFLLFVHGLIILTALHVEIDRFRTISAGVGLLVIIIGNYLPKVRYNYMMGFRNPWTLADERVWDRTHRLAGPLYILGGLALLGAAVLVPSQLQVMALLPCVLVPVAIGHGYSYLAARKLNLV